jgi:hypothetical protein
MAGLLFYQAVEKPALFVIRGDAKDLNYLKTRDLRDAPNDNFNKIDSFSPACRDNDSQLSLLMMRPGNLPLLAGGSSREGD